MIRSRRVPGTPGQATVELALALPVLVLLALFLVQVGLVVRAQILVAHAARAAARAAAVDPRPGAARAAARQSAPDGDRFHVSVRRSSGPVRLVTVVVREHVVTDVPLVGSLVGDVTVSATASLPAEPGPP